jgi:hypothetical protein
MTTVEDLLRNPDISDYMNSYRGAAERIEQAAKWLVEHARKDTPIEQLLTALKKLLPALTDKTVNVFFSYKKVDEKAAQQVVDLLRKMSADELRISYQGEFTEEIAGRKWRDFIKQKVGEANWFILLLPDPAEDWDWCLFETGVFEANVTSADLVICLHHPDIGTPSPIEGYHAVAATVQEVSKFLHRIFVEDNALPGLPAINKSIEPDIMKYAEKIVHAIRPPANIDVREIFEPWVALKLDDDLELAEEDDLDGARIDYISKSAMDLFGFIRPPRTWGELRKEVPEMKGDSRWRKELFHVIRRIRDGRKFYPVQAVFTTDEGKIYRPVLSSVDWIGNTDRIDTYHVTFAEDVGAVDRSEIPTELSVLATLLRYAFRFRFEILEKFAKPEISDTEIIRLENAVERIEIEADSRGVTDEEMLAKIFSKSELERVSKLYKVWKQTRKPDRTGALDLALKDRDADRIASILAELLPLNQEFLEIVSDRFSRLVAEPSQA